jgi:hypothetical protein
MEKYFVSMSIAGIRFLNAWMRFAIFAGKALLSDEEFIAEVGIYKDLSRKMIDISLDPPPPPR